MGEIRSFDYIKCFFCMFLARFWFGLVWFGDKAKVVVGGCLQAMLFAS